MGCCNSAPQNAASSAYHQRGHRRHSSSLNKAVSSSGAHDASYVYAGGSDSARAHHDVEIDPDIFKDEDFELDEPGVASPVTLVETEAPSTPPLSEVTRTRISQWLGAMPETDFEPVPDCEPIDDVPALPHTFSGSGSLLAPPPSRTTTIVTNTSGGGIISFMEPIADRAYQDDAFPSPLPHHPMHASLSMSGGSSKNLLLSTPRRRAPEATNVTELPSETATDPHVQVTPTLEVVPVLSVEHYPLDVADCDGAGPSQQSPSHAMVMMLHPGFGLTRRSSRNTMLSLSAADVPARDSDLLLDYFDAIPQSRRRSEGTTVSSTLQPTPLPGQVMWSMLED